jgi:CRP-like cAMP-binding protein/LysM repeat protein
MQRLPRGARQLAAELLKPMPLFAGMADDALVGIARKLRPAQFCADSLVFSEGQSPESMYIVETGSVTLLSSADSGRVPVAEIGPRDFFGEDALLTDQTRELAAMVSAAADVWSLHRTDFDALVADFPAAAIKMTRALAARSEQLNRQLLSLAARGEASVYQPTATPAPAVVRTAPAPRPAIARQPLGATLKNWLASLSFSGKMRLAVISVLLAWLLLVSIPSAIASNLSGTTQAPSLGTRGSATVAQSFRGSTQVRGPEAPDLLVASVEVVGDVSEAPLARMADLVAVPAPAAAPVAAIEPVVAAAVPLAAAPKPAVTYSVAPGDTLSQIAAEFNVSVDVLAEANELGDGSLIRVDQKLVIPGGEEQAAIAAKLAAAPRPTPTPAPVRAAPAPAPVAAVAAAPAAAAKPALPFTWDGRIDKYGVRMDAAAVADGQTYYRLVKAIIRDVNEPVPNGMPGGDHNIFLEVLDENGKRLTGAKAVVRNGGTAMILIEDKPFPEYGGNFPMYGMTGSYTAFVDGLPSDQVVGMGLPMKHHVSFFLTFQRTTK